MRPHLPTALAVLVTLPALAASKPVEADPSVRDSAQRGVNFLARTALEWQRSHGGCFGCHVQAVTIEGLAVGAHHQYQVPKAERAELIQNMIKGATGIRSPGGLSPSTFPKTSRAFAGAGLARHDAYVDSALRDDLYTMCRQLLPMQTESGAVVGDHPVMGPVASGTLQTTFQAMQTWRQCYARTADDAWRGPLRRAERFVASTARGWDFAAKDKVALQDLNHALMALLAAGASPSEDGTARLVKELRERQGKDGGWAFGQTKHPLTNNFLSYESGDVTKSNPLATGQSVYALKLAGFSEKDAAVARGIGWLVSHQQRDGGWGSTGAAKAEAMWAVLGLVSVDVMTLAVRGVRDGEHVAEGDRVVVEAKDNSGSTVSSVALFVDDAQVATVQGPELSFPLGKLSTGRHFIDAVAENAKGQTSRRRLAVFAGDVFVTELGTRFDDAKGATEVSLRNLTGEGKKGQVELQVFALGEKASEAKAERRVFTTRVKSAPGPLTLPWAGTDDAGKAQAPGRYLARVAFLDEKGATLQQESVIFFHGSEQVQKAKTAEVEGMLGMKQGIGFAAESEVELVDESGAVVATTRSNEQGNFRFKAVPKGNYKVRAKKDGFKPLESAPVKAEPGAAPAAASMSW